MNKQADRRNTRIRRHVRLRTHLEGGPTRPRLVAPEKASETGGASGGGARAIVVSASAGATSTQR